MTRDPHEKLHSNDDLSSMDRDTSSQHSTSRGTKKSHLPEDYVSEKRLFRFRPSLSSIIYTRPSLHCILASGIMMCSAIAWSYSNTVINTAELTFRECTGNENGLLWWSGCIQFDSSFKWGLAVSIFNFGALLSAPLAPFLAEWISRYRVVYLSNIFNIIGIACQIFFNSWWTFTLGRFISGVHAGLVSIVVNLYLLEIAPPNLVGSFIAAAHAIGFGVGMCSGSILGMFFSGNMVWRLLFAGSMILSLLQGYLLPYCPHSPKWLVKKMNVRAARNTLLRLRSVDPEKADTTLPIPQIENELSIVKQEAYKSEKEGSWRDLMRWKNLQPLLVSLFLNVSSPMTGVVAVFFFSTSVFSSMVISSHFITLILFVTYFIGSVLSMPLLGVFNRKVHLLIADGVEAASMVVLSLSFIFVNVHWVFGVITVVATILFLLSHAIGVGPLTGILSSEINHVSVSGKALSLCMLASWIINIAIGFLFPIVADLLKNFVFLPFMVVNVVMFISFFFIIDRKPKQRAVKDAQKAAEEVAHQLIVDDPAAIVKVETADGEQLNVPLVTAVEVAKEHHENPEKPIDLEQAFAADAQDVAVEH